MPVALAKAYADGHGDSRAVVRFYNKLGTAEQRIKESKQAVAMTRLGCHHFRAKRQTDADLTLERL
ncbi:MAG: hypothetical protein ACLQU2_35110 [Candidatus Binataceae bacterium]